MIAKKCKINNGGHTYRNLRITCNRDLPISIPMLAGRYLGDNVLLSPFENIVIELNYGK